MMKHVYNVISFTFPIPVDAASQRAKMDLVIYFICSFVLQMFTHLWMVQDAQLKRSKVLWGKSWKLLYLYILGKKYLVSDNTHYL